MWGAAQTTIVFVSKNVRIQHKPLELFCILNTVKHEPTGVVVFRVLVFVLLYSYSFLVSTLSLTTPRIEWVGYLCTHISYWAQALCPQRIITLFVKMTLLRIHTFLLSKMQTLLESAVPLYTLCLKQQQQFCQPSMGLFSLHKLAWSQSHILSLRIHFLYEVGMWIRATGPCCRLSHVM